MPLGFDTLKLFVDRMAQVQWLYLFVQAFKDAKDLTIPKVHFNLVKERPLNVVDNG